MRYGLSKCLRAGRYIENELKYNRDTWAGWTKGTGVTADSSGLSIDVAQSGSALLNTNLKTSTKYGMILNVITNTLAGANIYCILGSIAFPTSIVIAGGGMGNGKGVITTGATIANNRIEFGRSASGGTGLGKIADIRIFELPAGSEIEADFTNLIADQLMAKYPFDGAYQGNLSNVLS